MILGGIEASLRRLSHYDYWSDQVRRSVLLDSGADLISYGMGELSIVAIADALAAGIDVHDVTFIPGTVYRSKTLDHLIDPVVLPSFEEVRESKRTYAESFAIQYKNTDAINAKPMAEPYEGQGYIVQNPPSRPLTEQEMDDVYALPYMRAYHPSYEKRRRCAGAWGNQIQSDEQPRLLWVLQFLRADVPRGTRCADKKPRIHSGGSAADGSGKRI